MDIELLNKIETDYKNGERKINAVYDNGEHRQIRLGITASGQMLYMKPRSRRRGSYLNSEKIISYKLPKKPDIKRKWERSIDRAIGMLEESGLWGNMLKNLKVAREVGYEKLQEAHRLYWRDEDGINSCEEQDKRNANAIERIIDKRLVYITDDNRKLANTDIIWYMNTPLKIMKMVFSQYGNDERLKQITEAIKNKKKYTETGYYQYDNSFEYNGEDKAWYSREFRGCGNGHYYLALNGTHAVFYEDD